MAMLQEGTGYWKAARTHLQCLVYRALYVSCFCVALLTGFSCLCLWGETLLPLRTLYLHFQSRAWLVSFGISSQEAEPDRWDSISSGQWTDSPLTVSSAEVPWAGWWSQSLVGDFFFFFNTDPGSILESLSRSWDSALKISQAILMIN